MSLVGPRPEQPYYVEQFRRSIPRYMDRHREKAGLTGWAQINGYRQDTSITERTKYDLWYIENWSLMLDIKILIRTLLQILSIAECILRLSSWECSLNKPSSGTVPSTLYNEQYFLHVCEGYQEYLSSEGEYLSQRLAEALAVAGIAPGMAVLDVGCGRGEMLRRTTRLGARAFGIDYAQGRGAAFTENRSAGSGRW